MKTKYYFNSSHIGIIKAEEYYSIKTTLSLSDGLHAASESIGHRLLLMFTTRASFNEFCFGIWDYWLVFSYRSLTDIKSEEIEGNILEEL